MMDCGEVIFSAEIANAAQVGLVRGGCAQFLWVLRSAPADCKLAVV